MHQQLSHKASVFKMILTIPLNPLSGEKGAKRENKDMPWGRMNQRTKRGRGKTTTEKSANHLYSRMQGKKLSLFDESRPPSTHPPVKSRIILLSASFPDQPLSLMLERLPSSAKKWSRFTAPLGESSGRERMLEGKRQNFTALSYPALLRASKPVLKLHK